MHRLMREKTFFEWHARSHVEVMDVAQHIAHAIEEYGLRFFRNYEDEDRLIMELTSERSSRVLLVDSLSEVAMLVVLI